MFTRSIRWRFQLWLAFLLACILAGFGLTAYQLHRLNRLSEIDEELDRRVSALSGDLRGRPPFGRAPEPPPFDQGAGPPRPRRPGLDFMPRRGGPDDGPWPREIRLSPETASLFSPATTNSFYYAIWSRGGTILTQASNAPPGLSLPGRLDAGTGTHARMSGKRREVFQFTEMGDCVLAGRSIAGDLHAIRRFAAWLVAAGGAVLALGLGGGWLLAGRAIRPIEDISAAASRISAGNLAERISVAETESELGRLAGVLNSTFARLETAFAQQKQFTADASHELRTPLTVLISEAQSTLARPRSAAEYRETLEACLETAQQMRRLSQSLLELARFDAGQESMARSPFDLAERTRACVELLSPLAAQRSLEISCDLAPAIVLGDADRFSQVILNLLTNALDHSKPNGTIRASTRAEKGAAVLTLADTGSGIAPEDLPHVFERFYRGDKARSRAGGRAGLGLAICKAIVDAHGGTIEVASQLGTGTTFTVRLPI